MTVVVLSHLCIVSLRLVHNMNLHVTINIGLLHW